MQVARTDDRFDPEELVCAHARNDYRQDGVIDHTFAEIMEGVTADDTIVSEVINEQDEHVGYSEDAGFEDEALSLEAKKRTLIKHTMNEGHWGVFEHPSISIALHGVTRVSMAQITRHRHFTFDIMSLRYVSLDGIEELSDRFQIPKVVYEDEIVTRDGEVVEIDSEKVERIFINAYGDAIDRYQELLAENVPAEEARKVLPLGVKVNICMTGNARAWMHLLNIRGKANVQQEAQDIANEVFDVCKDWMPYTFERYDEYHLPMKLNP